MPTRPTPDLLNSGARAISLMQAAAELDISRSVAYELARQGRFPVRVLKIGGQYRVPVAALRRYLDLPAEPTPAERVAG